jgi:hypothetical protein
MMFVLDAAKLRKGRAVMREERKERLESRVAFHFGLTSPHDVALEIYSAIVSLSPSVQ